MFDVRKYYENENEKVRDSYEKTLSAIKEICDETKGYRKAGEKKEYFRFFNTVGKFILKMADYEKKLRDDYFSTKTFEELLKENNEFYEEILPENYKKKSYANPSNCVDIFGDKFGQLLSYFYCQYRHYITHAFYHKIFRMDEYNRLFIDVFNYVKNKGIEYKTLKELITRPQRKDKTEDIIHQLKEQFDRNFKYNIDIVENRDLSDLRYLFGYRNLITKNEIKTARFLLDYSEDKIKKLSQQGAKAYIDGFERSNKDISGKSTVMLTYYAGQERLIRQLIKDLKKYNLEALISSVSSTNLNKQYGYDHRFDTALFLDEEYTDLFKKNFEEAGKKCKEILSVFSGIIPFSTFGEPPFNPENKKECIRFTEEQQKLFRIHQNNLVKIREKYLPMKEISFSAISFPSPEVGKNFGQVFEDILEINMLDTEQYEGIQQKIIDVLDKADYVYVKGKGKSKTDIKVKMQGLKNPDNETNFLNCGADINIPLGEVYTSPQLKATNGILHIEEAYLGGLKYIDLELTFKDGYIVDYDCNNFAQEEDNKKYIEENLLFPHKTLPLGEFAIGTNTLAYVIAKKHNIMNILPVLIMEKMGPHFAIGDTCFALSEDKPVFNRLDNKEVTARENEKTALRKTKPGKAYTYRHQDITIPYESINFITVVAKNGERIDIIKDGRFVLAGTEELNKPFEKRAQEHRSTSCKVKSRGGNFRSR